MATFSQYGWSWDNPLLPWEATYSGYDDPNSGIPIFELQAGIVDSAPVYSRFVLTVEEPLLCVDAIAVPTMLANVRDGMTMDADVETDETLGIELADEPTMGVDVETAPTMSIEVEDEACR